MFENEFYISSLIAAHLAEELSDDQQLELNTWLEKSPENQLFFDELINEQSFSEQLSGYRNADSDSIWQKTNAKIKIAEESVQKPLIKKLFPIYKIAAAITILALGAGLLYFMQKGNFGPDLSKQAKASNIKPGKNIAVLTLADGSTIDLSSAQTGVIVNEEQLVYNDGSRLNDSVKALSNLNNQTANLTTPRGGMYQITLSDGTKVWINSSSILKFPVAFNTKERNVELTGEAYFEVAKDPLHPFVVTTKGQRIKVLGTHFNVNSYADEANEHTTLLEGSVNVTLVDGVASKTIQPLQQAVSSKNDLTVKNANIDEVMAWKEGYFRFYREDLGSIMRKISRWYNVDVVFDGGEMQYETFVFDGVVNRSKGIAEVLSIIERTGKVNFSIEKNKVIVNK